jgi:hypothetical protein
LRSVLVEAEDGGAPVVHLVGADALESRGAVMEGVGEDVDAGVVPVDLLSVHPYGPQLLDHAGPFKCGRGGLRSTPLVVGMGAGRVKGFSGVAQFRVALAGAGA